MGESTATRDAVLLRPLWQDFAGTLTLCTAAGLAPVVLALAVLSQGTLVFHTVIGAALIAVLGTASAGLRVRTASLEIAADGIREHHYFGRTVLTPAPDVAVVLVVDVASGSGSARQIFVLDAGGRTRVRVSARFWEPGVIETLAAAYPVEVVRVSGPISVREFRRAYRPRLRWHERHLWVITAGTCALALLVLVPALAATTTLH
ncbi:MAG: hypothetical protein JWP66_1437 [Naasia sp.]|nr:hypothetical protein [Naasia sp.]